MAEDYGWNICFSCLHHTLMECHSRNRILPPDVPSTVSAPRFCSILFNCNRLLSIITFYTTIYTDPDNLLLRSISTFAYIYETDLIVLRNLGRMDTEYSSEAIIAARSLQTYTVRRRLDTAGPLITICY